MSNIFTLLKDWLQTTSYKQKLTATLLVLGVVSTIGLFAMQGTSGTTSDPLESTPFYFFSVFVKLVVVLLLIIVSSVIFRRWLQPGAMGRKSRQLQLIETVRLSPKQALHLVAVGDQKLLVGATDQGISLITQVELMPTTTETEIATSQPGTDFASLLQTFSFGSPK